MKQLIILLAVVLLAGCNPCKRLTRKCPTHDSTFVLIETIRDTIWVYTPADTIQIAIPMDMVIDLGDLGFIVEDNNQKIAVTVLHDTLFVKSECKADSLQAIVDSQRTTINNTKTVYQDVEVEVEVVRNSKFARFCIIAFFCVVLIVIALIVYRIKVGTLKSALKRFNIR